MKKQPFTNIGFANLQSELYKGPDEQLFLEAEAIKLDFKKWMYNQFELEPSQLKFLSELVPSMIVHLSEQTSFAVANRLPVTLNKSEEGKEGDKPGKIINSKSNFSASAGTSIPFLAEGDLTIEILYQS